MRRLRLTSGILLLLFNLVGCSKHNHQTPPAIEGFNGHSTSATLQQNTQQQNYTCSIICAPKNKRPTKTHSVVEHDFVEFSFPQRMTVNQCFKKYQQYVQENIDDAAIIRFSWTATRLLT